MPDKKEYPVELFFDKTGHTVGWTMTATSKEDALARVQRCIDEHGNFDSKKFTEQGGEMESWTTKHGEDFNYRIDEDDIGDPEGVE